MSAIPKPDKKPKYNHNDPFIWVDSQWEKFMTEQKELKARIKDLENQLERLVYRVPSGYLTGLVKKYPNDFKLGEKVREMVDNKDKYIYESPDGGKTVYRREFGDYDSERELVSVSKKLQEDLGTCTEHFQTLRKENEQLKETIREIGGEDLYKYIFHSKDSNQLDLFSD